MRFWYVAPALLSAIAFAACGDGSGDVSAPNPVVSDPEPVHVHGLGINPADRALFIATHTGLFRAPAGQQRARRVGDRLQDTMGFTVTGPNRFLGSGHPDGRDNLPPFLGLIRSSDAGQSWQPVSLLGERDFHVLEAAGRRIYGYGSDYESRQAGLLVSDDGGRTWDERTPPEPLGALAIDPQDPDHVIASGRDGLYSSSDAASGWRPLTDEAGLLAWTETTGLFVVRFDGQVARSRDGGRTWQKIGTVDAQPAALDSAGDELYLALHDGTVKYSHDGRKWQLRSHP
jgi:hypothetical protein